MCTGRCRWTANKAFQEMTIIGWVTYSFDLVLNESIFYIFNIFTATRQTKSCNGSSFAWLTHWVTSLKLLVSSTSQVSPLDGSVIELFSYSCVYYAGCFWLCTPLVDQLGKACVHLQFWFCPHTHIQNTRVLIHNLHPLEEVCVGGIYFRLKWKVMCLPPSFES